MSISIMADTCERCGAAVTPSNRTLHETCRPRTWRAAYADRLRMRAAFAPHVRPLRPRHAAEISRDAASWVGEHVVDTRIAGDHVELEITDAYGWRLVVSARSLSDAREDAAMVIAQQGERIEAELGGTAS